MYASETLGGRDASTHKVACREMESLFVRSHEKDGYQHKLNVLLAEEHHRSAVPAVVATDLLCLAKYLGHVYIVVGHVY